jgi:ribosomal-protein-alanine N-acetyltransferase
MSISERAAVRFVRLAHEHLDALQHVEHEAYPDPWTRGMFVQEIAKPASYFCVAYLDDRIVGYAGFWLLIDEVHITKITVARPWRGQGLGRMLLDHIMVEGRARGGKTVRLEVREHNPIARALYQGAGFEEVGIRTGYYSRTNENAVVMVKQLPEAE